MTFSHNFYAFSQLFRFYASLKKFGFKPTFLVLSDEMIEHIAHMTLYIAVLVEKLVHKLACQYVRPFVTLLTSKRFWYNWPYSNVNDYHVVYPALLEAI